MEEFRRAVEASNKKIGVTSIGRVKRINGLTCEVERQDLPPLLDVRLQATDTHSDTRFLVVPKIGSRVLCLEVENQPSETAIVKYTEIEKVEIRIAEAEWVLSGTGKFTVKNKDVNLKELLTVAFDTINNSTITTPSGPGFFSEKDKGKLQDLKKKTLKLFE